MLLSILIPVYNERTVVEQSLSLVLAAPLPEGLQRELVIVDDRSRPMEPGISYSASPLPSPASGCSGMP